MAQDFGGRTLARDDLARTARRIAAHGMASMKNDRTSARAPRPKLEVRDLTPRDWPTIERLFGPRGACGGCWCMVWRVSGGKAWLENKGEKNRRAFKKLVTSGRVHGCLAFSGDEPVGWCCIGPKHDFAKLAKSRALATDADERTWG